MKTLMRGLSVALLTVLLIGTMNTAIAGEGGDRAPTDRGDNGVITSADGGRE